MVTAELAVTTLTAFTLLIVMCWGIYLVVLQVRCIDTASAVARQAARGDDAGGGPRQGRRAPEPRSTVQRRPSSWSP